MAERNKRQVDTAEGEGLMEDPGEDLNEDPGEDLNEDPRQDLNEDPRQDLNEDPRQDYDEDPGEASDEDPREDLEKKKRRLNSADVKKKKAIAENPTDVVHPSKAAPGGNSSSSYLILVVLVAVAAVVVGYFVLYKEPELPCGCDKKLTIFVTGKAGSGKTSLIYGLLGVSEDEMNRKRHNAAVTLQTENVTRNGIYVIVSERRSLEHDEKEVAEEEVSKVQNMDLVLYTLRMDDARCRPGHKTGLRKLGKQFGTDIWNKTVIALTFANRVDYINQEGETEASKALLDEKKKHWTQCVNDVLIEDNIPEAIMKDIPMVPVGYYKKPRLFDESWVDALYGSMLSRLSEGRAYSNFKLAFNITS